MFVKGLLFLTLALMTKHGFVAAKPCFSDLFGSLFDYDDDDTKPTGGPAFPSQITIFLTPVANASSLQAMIQEAQNGSIFLLPSLFPLQQGGQASATTTTTTPKPVTTTYKPAGTPAAAPAAAGAPAAPGAAAPAVGAPPAAGAPAPAAGAPAPAAAPAPAG